MAKILTVESVLETTIEKYNEYSRLAAFWHNVEHPAWEKYATGATATLELIEEIFEPWMYRFVFVSEYKSGRAFEWRKMEVQ